MFSMREDEPQQPTWEDVQRAALHCPVLQMVVAAVARGLPRDEAMMTGLLFLAKERATLIQRGADLLAGTSRR